MSHLSFFKIAILILTVVSSHAFGENFQDYHFPKVNELKELKTLSNPFQFFKSDRQVQTQEDWEERRKEMLNLFQHYITGPAFPQSYNAKVLSSEKHELYHSKATQYHFLLAMGPEHQVRFKLELIHSKQEKKHPLLFYICPKKELENDNLKWREKIIDRGYSFAWINCDEINGYQDGPVKVAFPSIKGNTMMAWAWGVNECLDYLDKKFKFDKLIVTGTSRFGRTATMVGAINENVDLTVPVVGGFGVHLFNAKLNKTPANRYTGRCWVNDEFPKFAGQLNKLPVDHHFLGALIAPRAYLGIMGEEYEDKQIGDIEAYEALKPVYQWLGAEDKLGLYHHAPLGHVFVEEDYYTILDFADQVFYNKQPTSGKKFDQQSHPKLSGFDYKAPSSIN